MSSSSTITRLFVSCAGALEPLLAEELKELGITGIEQSFRGIFLPKKIENVYLVNYASRIATRVLWPLCSFPCPDKESLYRGTRTINWKDYLNPKMTFSIDANVTPHPTIKNSHFAALVVKDAICDAQREAFSDRSTIDLSNPDLQLNLFLHKGKATLYLDTSGQPLFKRGYRIATGEAPLQESLAAAILRLAKYEPETDILADPFVGSGTFLIEAAMMATRTPAGYFRKRFGFEAMPEFSASSWKSIKEQLDSKRHPLQPGKLFGADQDVSSVELCRKHLDRTGFGAIDVVTRPVERFRPKKAPSLVVANPPYGKRLTQSKDLFDHFKHFLETTGPRTAYFLTPAGQHIDMPCRKAFSCLNGGLEVDLLYRSLS
jgi:putative N6-adenine-specific DNA methylase